MALVRYAVRSLARRPLTAVLLAVSLGIAFGLPGAVRSTVAAFETELTSRAAAASLVLGAPGSESDLVLNALYFRNEPPGTITVADRQAIDDQRIAKTIPLCVQATVRSVPVVGTDGSYFELRKLRLSSGSPIARLGDCVLGARAAETLRLTAGDTVATDPENLFGGNGGAPVRLNVTGVLSAAGTADDDAAFVNLETAWLIAGLGHAHSNASSTHSHEDSEATPSGFIEVTDENVDSFHFHGRRTRFPLTAVIVIPDSNEDRLLLVARSATRQSGPVLAEPDRVLRDLLDVAVRVRRLFEANAAVMAIATSCLCAAIVALSVRLRWSEVRTMHRLGLPRHRITALFGIELLIVAVAAAAIALALLIAFRAAAPMLFRWFVG